MLKHSGSHKYAYFMLPVLLLANWFGQPYYNQPTQWEHIYTACALTALVLTLILKQPVIAATAANFTVMTGLTNADTNAFLHILVLALAIATYLAIITLANRKKTTKIAAMKPRVKPRVKPREVTLEKPLYGNKVQITPKENIPAANKHINQQVAAAQPETNLEKPSALEVIKPEDVKIDFTNVIGMEEAKTDLLESMKLIENPTLAEKHGIEPIRGILLHGLPGTGKCLAKGTPVLKYNGEIAKVEDIKLGELLMGPDSEPRIVTNLARGQETMYEIRPIKGEPFTVNESHILSLKMSTAVAGYRKGEIVNLSIKEYLAMSEGFKAKAKTWRTGVDFPAQKTTIDPYLLGVWLGDGAQHAPIFTTVDKEIQDAVEAAAKEYGMECHNIETREDFTPQYRIVKKIGRRGGQWMDNTLWQEMKDLNLNKNKHIPHVYKANTKEVRAQVLAGLMDTDGSLTCGGFDYISKSKELAQDTAYLARSLGLAAYVKKTYKIATNSAMREKKLYYRVSISGNCAIIPTRLKRKQATERMQVKDVCVTGFSVHKKEVDDYYGFSLAGNDRLFLLGDFTVTHNTFFAKAAAGTVKKTFLKVSAAELVNKYVGETEKNVAEVFAYARQNYPCILFFDEFDAIAGDREKAEHAWEKSTVNQLLTELDGITGKDRAPIIIAATNHINNIDSAVKREGRFDKKIEVKLPTLSDRARLLQMYLKARVNPHNPIDWKLIAQKTEGFTPAKIKQLVTRTQRNIFRETPDDPRPILTQDLLDTLKTY